MTDILTRFIQKLVNADWPDVMYICPVYQVSSGNLSNYSVSAKATYSLYIHCVSVGTVAIGLSRGLATLPQGNQEPLVVMTKTPPPRTWGSRIHASRIHTFSVKIHAVHSTVTPDQNWLHYRKHLHHITAKVSFSPCPSLNSTHGKLL